MPDTPQHCLTQRAWDPKSNAITHEKRGNFSFKLIYVPLKEDRGIMKESGGF